MYQKLKMMLEEEHEEEFYVEDVREIADNLVEFYLLLARLETKQGMRTRESRF